MGKFDSDNLMNLIITLIFVSFLLPIGLIYLLNIGSVNVLLDGANVTLNDSTTGQMITTLIITLVPLAIGLGLTMYFVKKFKGSSD